MKGTTENAGMEVLDMKDYHAGDICTYPHGAGNRSFAVVEPVRILNDPSGAAEIRFLEVLVDDTGNGTFTYLHKTGKTMNASLRYMKKVSP